MKKVGIVYTGRRKREFKPLSEADWRDIEAQSGFTLNAITRSHLNRITHDYVTKGPPSALGISPLELSKKVGMWIVRTDGLRAQIANNPAGTSRKAKNYRPEEDRAVRATIAYTNLKKLADMYFQSVQERAATGFSADHLAQFLKEVTKVAEGMAIHISRYAPRPTPKMQWWLVWVTLVILQVRKYGFSVSWKKDKKKGVRDEFVQFITLLQKHMPNDCAPRRSHESVRKGIVLAIGLTGGRRIAELKGILRRWGQGEFDLAAKAASFGMRRPKMFMTWKMLDRIERQASPIRNRMGSKKVGSRS